jgi:endogenous inhibitor of DNA gyrase (YacG/DUF329 family)
LSPSAICPICKKPAKPRTENQAFPFCSARCKQVELGKWLNEEYRLPVEEEDDDPGKSGAGHEDGKG